MRTLRVKLVVPEAGSHDAARAAFDELSERHSDQAIFQVNRTRYVDDDSWGFQVRYETAVYTTTEFVRSTSLWDIEGAMAELAPDSFEPRIHPG